MSMKLPNEIITITLRTEGARSKEVLSPDVKSKSRQLLNGRLIPNEVTESVLSFERFVFKLTLKKIICAAE